MYDHYMGWGAYWPNRAVCAQELSGVWQDNVTVCVTYSVTRGRYVHCECEHEALFYIVFDALKRTAKEKEVAFKGGTH